jgi:hypothetical protein
LGAEPGISLKVGGKTIAPDGTLRDEFYLRHGCWEAKDTHDDLNAEIRAKIKKGYPLSNTIFEDAGGFTPQSGGVSFAERVDQRSVNC